MVTLLRRLFCMSICICYQSLIVGFYRYYKVAGEGNRILDLTSSSSGDYALLPTEKEVVAKSIHLQLRDINEFDSIIKPDVDENDDSDSISTNGNNTKSLVVSEFLNVNDSNSTIVAALSSATSESTKRRLEHFGRHLFNVNYSIRSDAVFSETVVDPENQETYQKYLSLWKEGRFILQSKNFAEAFSKSHNSKRKIPFEPLLKSSHRRMKEMSVDNNVSACATYLREQTILDKPFEAFLYNASAPKNETLATLKSLSIWFREQFPYFYDQCSCCLNTRNNSYLGTIFPSETERTYLAGRTELYLCGLCNNTSRFPRYNNVAKVEMNHNKVLETRRGRCGEYSVLMMLFLDALQYDTRWVVDIDDHVWTEARVGAEWIHIDPCEAAVDEPLIYQGWGKNQTFIFAYKKESEKEDRASVTVDRSLNLHSSILDAEITVDSSSAGNEVFVTVEDVTMKYTDNATAVLERRLLDGVNHSYIQTEISKLNYQEKVDLS